MLLYDSSTNPERYKFTWTGKQAQNAWLSKSIGNYGPYKVECRAWNLKQLMYLGGSIKEFWQIMLQLANEMEQQDCA